MSTNVNYVAFGTVTLLGIATAGSAIMAATTASTIAAVAYGILAIGLSGLSIASVTAWVHRDSKDVQSYFDTMKSHSGIAVAGMFQATAQTLVASVIQGVGTGVGRSIGRKIGGDDVTIGVNNR